jgi:hypothetical protein
MAVENDLKRNLACIATSAVIPGWHLNAGAVGLGNSDQDAGGGALLVAGFVVLMYLVVMLLRAVVGGRDQEADMKDGLEFDKRTRSLSDSMGDRT